MSKYKLKTKSSAKKRFVVTASGKIKAKYSCKSHFLRRRSQDMKRSARGTKVLAYGDSRLVQPMLRASF
jgi:large subunit ribosomal protein L35